MSSEPIVPSDVLVFVLGRQTGDLRSVELSKQLPHPIDRRHKQRVGVHVQHGIDVFQYILL